MIFKRHAIAAALFSLASLGLGQAHAATINLNLTGTVSNGQLSAFDSGGTHYDQWYLNLSGITPFTVSNGDMINATITLDQSFTIPASVTYTQFEFDLTGASFPNINTGTNGTTAFFNGVNPGPSDSETTTTSNQLAAAAVFFPPNNSAITFDSVISSFTITTLASPATIDGANISYTLTSPAPVPLPQSFAMLLSGLGLVGFAARRRKVISEPVTYATLPAGLGWCSAVTPGPI